ncbi:MAG: hypothetical protein M1319_06680 [Chloroflexi bacterium]|nr:hypothetical protein [Chloroflexota bacterium]
MIARISSEGQYRLDDGDVIKKLDEIDDKLVDVCARDDEAEYQRLFGEMLTLVRKEGHPVPVTELVKSDVILPAPGTTLAEAKEIFRGEGMFAC